MHSAEQQPGLRPDWNGRLFRAPGKPEQYLIDSGYRRWISDGRVVERLFVTVNEEENGEVLAVPEGSPVPSDAALVKAMETGAVYLIDMDPRPDHGTERVRRRISPDALSRYHLREPNDPAIPFAPGSVLEEIRSGPELN